MSAVCGGRFSLQPMRDFNPIPRFDCVHPALLVSKRSDRSFVRVASLNYQTTAPPERATSDSQLSFDSWRARAAGWLNQRVDPWHDAFKAMGRFEPAVDAASAGLTGEFPPASPSVLSIGSTTCEPAYGQGVAPFLRHACETGVPGVARVRQSGLRPIERAASTCAARWVPVASLINPDPQLQTALRQLTSSYKYVQTPKDVK